MSYADYYVNNDGANGTNIASDDIFFANNIVNIDNAAVKNARQLEIAKMINETNHNSLSSDWGQTPNPLFFNKDVINDYLIFRGRNYLINLIDSFSDPQKISLNNYTSENLGLFGPLNRFLRQTVQNQDLADVPTPRDPPPNVQVLMRSTVVNIDAAFDSIPVPPIIGNSLILYRGINVNYFNDVINEGNDHIESQFLSGSLDIGVAANFARGDRPNYNPNGIIIGIIIPPSVFKVIPLFQISDYVNECEMMLSRHCILNLVAGTTFCMDRVGNNLARNSNPNNPCHDNDSPYANVRYYFEVSLNEQAVIEHVIGGNSKESEYILTPYESMYNQIVEYEKNKNKKFKNINLIKPHKIFENKTTAKFPNFTYDLIIEKTPNLSKLQTYRKTINKNSHSIQYEHAVSSENAIAVAAGIKSKRKNKRKHKTKSKRKFKRRYKTKKY
jgi:hypothetical protein